MVTKRTPVSRSSKARITDELIEAFIRYEELSPIRDACIADDKCRSTVPNQHCPECREHVELSNKLHRMVGAKVWECSGLDADAPEPPDDMRKNPMMCAAWRRSWRLRCELEAAAAKLKA